MAWQPLADRVDRSTDPFQVPLILAGPIVRRVTKESVTIWLALRDPCSVRLRVFASQTTTDLIDTTSSTIELGERLHLVAITGAPLTGDPLEVDTTYLYDLEFTDGSGTVHALDDDGVIEFGGTADSRRKRLALSGFTLPSFVLPQTLDKLRIVHASCRKPHGESYDAFKALHTMLEEDGADPAVRPQQLFLTGDQIYADDVADALMKELMSGADWLMGRSGSTTGNQDYETLPLSDGPPLEPRSFPAGTRATQMWDEAGFTSGPPTGASFLTASSHLMSFAEYCAMYLYAWSPALWPETLPSFEQIYETPEFGDYLDNEGRHHKWCGCIQVDFRFIHELHLDGLQKFRTTLQMVQRALANISTYMIFDDHEVTDDWLLNKAWLKRVLGRADKPLGPRVLLNGLSSYALFQHWGNVPSDFEPGRPGRVIIDQLVGWDRRSPAPQALVNALGLPSIEDQTASPLIRPSNRISWHYHLVWDEHELIVLDTRTERGYPGDLGFPELLEHSAFATQIPVARDASVRVTLVLAPAPVFGMPFLEEHQYDTSGEEERFESDCEAWGLQPRSVDMLLNRFAMRDDPSSGPHPGIVFLSGDVHYGFAQRARFWADHPYNGHSVPNKDRRVDLVFAQLTASSLKNETSARTAILKNTHMLHGAGYRIAIDAMPLPSLVFGWNQPFGVDDFEWESHKAFSQHPKNDKHVYRGGPCFRFADPIVPRMTAVNLTESSWYLTLDTPHDWAYRVEALLAEAEERSNSSPNPTVAHSPGAANREEALDDYLEEMDAFCEYGDKWGDGKELVGVNNLGEVVFDPDPSAPKVIQYVWWSFQTAHYATDPDEDESRDEFHPLSKYVVDLSLEPITDYQGDNVEYSYLEMRVAPED